MVSRVVNGEVSPGEPEDLAEGSREGQEALVERVSQDTKKKEADHIRLRGSVGPYESF